MKLNGKGMHEIIREAKSRRRAEFLPTQGEKVVKTGSTSNDSVCGAVSKCYSHTRDKRRIELHMAEVRRLVLGGSRSAFLLIFQSKSSDTTHLTLSHHFYNDRNLVIPKEATPLSQKGWRRRHLFERHRHFAPSQKMKNEQTHSRAGPFDVQLIDNSFDSAPARVARS